jgi:hypothetical protein
MVLPLEKQGTPERSDVNEIVNGPTHSLIKNELLISYGTSNGNLAIFLFVDPVEFW